MGQNSRSKPRGLALRGVPCGGLPNPVSDGGVMPRLVLAEAQPVGAIICVLAPPATGEAASLPHETADGTDFQQVCYNMAGDLPPAVECFELFSHFIQFVITQHCQTLPIPFHLDAIDGPMKPRWLR